MCEITKMIDYVCEITKCMAQFGKNVGETTIVLAMWAKTRENRAVCEFTKDGPSWVKPRNLASPWRQATQISTQNPRVDSLFAGATPSKLKKMEALQSLASTSLRSVCKSTKQGPTCVKTRTLLTSKHSQRSDSTISVGKTTKPSTANRPGVGKDTIENRLFSIPRSWLCLPCVGKTTKGLIT